MLDILCIGDAKIDILLQIPDEDPHFSLDEAKNNLQISYGRKISIENYIKTLGGNACNAAVGLARLGSNTGLCAEIGTDEFSNFILNSLVKENINTNFILQDKIKQTSFSVCINYKGERTLLSEHIKRDHNFNFEATSANFLYLTSLGPVWENIYQKVYDFTKNKELTLAFNPGTLQVKSKERIVKELISISNYLFVNREEAEILLYGKDVNLLSEQKEIKKLLFGLKSLGAKIVIITDSKNGSYVYNGINIFHLEILKSKVVDKTGAGDAYNAGFISAILQNKDIKRAMTWATLNAASVVEKIGAQEGLLNQEELLEKLQSLPDFAPKEI